MTITFFNLPRAGASFLCLVILGAAPWAAPKIARADSLLVGTQIQAAPFEFAIDLSGQRLDAVEITATGELLSGLAAIYGDGASVGDFTNGGKISAANGGSAWAGVNLERSSFGQFTNAAGGTISGDNFGLRAAWTDFVSFANDGQIRGGSEAATGTGLSFESVNWGLSAGGTFLNGTTGQIAGAQRGMTLDFVNLAEFTNRGLIEATDLSAGFGLEILSSTIGTFTNEAGGTIRGGSIGIALTTSSITGFVNNGTIEGATAIAYAHSYGEGLTLTNAGRIASTTNGTAIDFAYDDPTALRDDTLILKTGSIIEGAIRFAAGTDTLRFGDFAGSADLAVYDLEDIEPGDRLFTRYEAATEGDPDRVVIVAPEAVDPGNVGESTNGVVQGLAGLIATQAMSASYAGTLLSPAAAAGGSAVLTALDIGEAERPRLWADVFGYSSNGPSPAQLSGLALGADTKFGGVASAGALLSYSQSSARFAQGNHALSSHTGVGGFYGTWHAGVLDIGFSLLGGVQAHDSARHIATGGGAETARGRFAGVFAAPGASASLPLITTGATTVSLRGSATYVAGITGGYTETGSSSNLTVGPRSIATLDARFGVDARQAIRTVSLEGEGMLRAGVFTLVNGGGTSVPVTLMGQTVDVPTAHSTAYGLYAGAGAAADLSETIRFELNADTAARLDGTLSVSLRGGISGTF